MTRIIRRGNRLVGEPHSPCSIWQVKPLLQIDATFSWTLRQKRLVVRTVDTNGCACFILGERWLHLPRWFSLNFFQNTFLCRQQSKSTVLSPGRNINICRGVSYRQHRPPVSPVCRASPTLRMRGRTLLEYAASGKTLIRHPVRFPSQGWN